MNNSKIDTKIFWPSLVVIISTTILLMMMPDAIKSIDSVLSFITHTFDWFFLIVVFFAMIWLVWLVLGPYGDIKFGEVNEKPEFSTFSWIAMLFCAGIGSALIYWAMVEPIYYISGPPFGIEPNTKKAAEWAIPYGMFHWGFSAWSIYTVPALAITYSLHVRKQQVLRPSIVFHGVLGDRVNGWIGKIIDIIIMFGLVGGVGTTLGVNVPMISAVVGKIFNIPQSIWLKIIIIAIWTVLFGTSAYLGIEKGIKKLSNINVISAMLLLIFILIVGPTRFILSNFTNSLGILCQNFFRMSLYTDPIMESSFPQNWTVFYWAWWFAYSVYMGLFVARISKGRTVRELIIAEVVWGSLGCFIFFTVFGGYAIHLDMHGVMPLVKIISEQGPNAVIVSMLDSLPLSKVIMPLFVVVSLIFQATTLDSSAYTLAAICTKRTNDSHEPAKWHRLFWALILGFVAIALMVVGGLKVVQLSSVIVSVPIVFIFILYIISFMKYIKQDYKKQ